ncbi:hypothetical protein TIFTF001_000080 [Ficus carica]|uniref:Uncharacterized protein n=1 Tax=Ficus carica TaxID=3494 RepID=A0AA87YW14_FICCA|nr:hypothetical protein TIFTF001_000080 [Ficus carica]
MESLQKLFRKKKEKKKLSLPIFFQLTGRRRRQSSRRKRGSSPTLSSRWQHLRPPNHIVAPPLHIVSGHPPLPSAASRRAPSSQPATSTFGSVLLGAARKPWHRRSLL